MIITLNASGESHARSLIEAGKYDETTPWTFSVEDGDKLLGAQSSNWTTFAQFHLGEQSGATDDSRGHWKCPYGKDGKVYRNALRSIRARASQLGATDVFDAAGRLIDQIEKAKSPDGTTSNVTTFRPSARAKPASSGYRIVQAAKANDPAEIYLYGIIGGGGWFDVGGVSADQFRKDLKALGDVKAIDVHVNSEGGDVFDGKAIYSQLAQHSAKINIIVDSLAASAASFICMAGNTITMCEGSFMMIHSAWAFAMGNAEEIRKTATLLDAVDGTLADVYAARTGQDLQKVQQMMSEETWMDAKQCMDMGFCDSVIENVKVAACVRDPSRYRNLPAALRPNRVAAMAALATS